jgi:hypothetical protein
MNFRQHHSKPHYQVKQKQKLMIYSDLIKLVGQYMTYSEFKRENPEVDLTEKDWYSILEGNTMRSNKADLKNRYISDFEQDWSNRRKVAFEILDHGKETSN